MSRQQRLSELLLSRKSGEARAVSSSSSGPISAKEAAAAAVAQKAAQLAATVTAVVEQTTEVETPASFVRTTRSRAATPVRAASSSSSSSGAPAVVASQPTPAPSPPKRKAPSSDTDAHEVPASNKKARSIDVAIAAAVVEPEPEPQAAAAAAVTAVAPVAPIIEELPALEPASVVASTQPAAPAAVEVPIVVETHAVQMPPAQPAAAAAAAAPAPTPAPSTPAVPVGALGRSRRGMELLARCATGVAQPPSAIAPRRLMHPEPVSAAASAVAAAAAASIAAAPSSATQSPSASSALFSSSTYISSAAAAAAAPSSPGTAGLVVAPFRSSAELQSRLSGLLKGVLPFPTYLTSLLAVFHAIDTVLLMERGRNSQLQTTSWEGQLQPSVQRLHPRSSVSLHMVQQILTLYPGCYTVIEAHSVNKFGKLVRDYRIGFGHGDALGSHLADDKTALAMAAKLPVSIEARRKDIEARMLHYVYEHHQRFLQRLLRQTQHDAMLSPSPATAAAAGVPTAVSGIEAFLSAPLSHLRAWYPNFSLDNPAHVPFPAAAPLPDAELQATLARVAHADSGRGLLELANRRQPLPHALSLASEQRGVANSTSHGVKMEAAAVSVPAVPATAAAPAAPVSKDLSILSADLVSSFRATLARNAAASLALHGDPVERERLRALLKLRPLYESISFATSSMKRYSLPLSELFAKTHPGENPSTLRATLVSLLDLIPTWASLQMTSGLTGPPREIIKVQTARACIDSATGRDKYLPIIEKAVRECEERISARSAPTVAAPAPAAVAAAAPAASDLATSSDSITVKLEPIELESEDVAMKQEEDPLERSSAAMAAAAAAIAERAGSRQAAAAPAAAAAATTTHTTVSYAAGVSASPLKSRTAKFSRAAAMALAVKSAAQTQTAAKPKPPATGTLAARLGSMR